MSALNAYILLDRSGSMGGRWDETLSSVNSYVEEVSKNAENSLITLAVFDGFKGLAFEVIRDKVKVKKWDKVTNKDATPRGDTPLFDSILRIVGLAEAADKKKTVIIVMTDGYENASKEATKDTARIALDRCRNKNWEVIFLGADFDAFGQASMVGTSTDKTLNMAAGNYGTSMRSLGAKSAMYATADCSISFSMEDRKDAVKLKGEIK